MSLDFHLVAEARWFINLEDLKKEKRKKTLVVAVSLTMLGVLVYWFLA